MALRVRNLENELALRFNKQIQGLHDMVRTDSPLRDVEESFHFIINDPNMYFFSFGSYIHTSELGYHR